MLIEQAVIDHTGDDRGIYREISGLQWATGIQGSYSGRQGMYWECEKELTGMTGQTQGKTGFLYRQGFLEPVVF